MASRFRSVEIVSFVSAIAAACFWALAGMSTWGRMMPRAVAIEVGAAVAASVIAAIGMMRERPPLDDGRGLAAEYERREEVLIRAVSRQLDVATTGPLPRLRSV